MTPSLTAAPALRARTRRRRLVATAALCGIAGWGLVEAGPALVVERRVDLPDAIIVLASHEWERLPTAAAVATEFPRATVLLTLPTVPSRWNCHLCAERVGWLHVLGVGWQRIVELPQRARNTYEEALATRTYAAEHGLKRILVVTSPYHTRRALNVFRHVLEPVGIEVGVRPAVETSAARPTRWWKSAADRAYVRYEWAALPYYRVRFGVPMLMN